MGSKAEKVKAPLFLALDLDDPERAKEIAQATSGWVKGYKVGPRLLMRAGGGFVKDLARWGQVFVDNKYFDIPSTMEAAVRATFEEGASFCTVHAASGPEALARLARVEKELNGSRSFQILAVTVLTSFHQGNRPPHWREDDLGDQIQGLAKCVFASGLSGIVCSPLEVAALKSLYPSGYFVTPGVRLKGDPKGDQARTLSPEEAMREGADALVVGRSIVLSPDPVRAVEEWAARLCP